MHVKNRAKRVRREKERATRPAAAAAMSITQGRVNLVCYFPANAAVVSLFVTELLFKKCYAGWTNDMSGCVSPVSAGSSVVATT